MSTAASKPRTSGPSYFATVPPQEILPITNARFESSIKGVFVIGDVTGLPLVKVAANQGVDVIAKMEEGRVFARAQDDDDSLDLVIVGGGPAGLSAAIEAHQRGLKYVVLERNKIVSTVRDFPPGKKVYAEPRFVRNTSQLDVDEDLERDEFLDRVQRLVEERQLHIKEDTEVAHVRKLGEQEFEVETSAGKSFPARQVLVAIGRQGQPRLLDCLGADNEQRVSYRLHTPEDYSNQDILVVGGGNSAIEAALMLMTHNRVTISYRGEEFFRAKTENRQRIERAIDDGQVTAIYQSHVKTVRGEEVDLDIAGSLQTIPNDHVIVQIGTLPPVKFLMDMGLELDGVWTRKRLAMAGAVAIGLYPFLGQRVWCRMWCPLAFWMNFWGRWSKFKITAEKGKYIDCNVCNQYCQMGIDIKSRALRGEPLTLVDTPCVGCAECVVRCPMEILHLGDAPSEKNSKLHQLPIVDLPERDPEHITRRESVA